MGQNHKNRIKQLAEYANTNFGHLVMEAQINYVLVQYSDCSPAEARRAVKSVILRKKNAAGDKSPIRTLANR